VLFRSHFDAHIIQEGFYGQEINHTTYNLARMNMFLHNINYDKFNIQLGNTLIDPHFGDEKPFDAIVSNPPYISDDEMETLAPEVRDWEPWLALTPGGDGLDPYRSITRDAPERLSPGGRLIVEIGAEQGAAVAQMFVDAGFVGIAVLRDLDGRDRVVRAEKP